MKLLCMEKKIQNFWNWFSAHEYEYRRVIAFDCERKEELWDWLLFFIDAYEPHLKFMMSNSKEEGGICSFVVSCDGDPAYFDAVERFVEAAPPLPFWDIKAFIEPDEDFVMDVIDEVDAPYPLFDLNLKASSLYFYDFSIDQETGKFFVHATFPGYHPGLYRDEVLQLLYYIMCDFLGEKVLYAHLCGADVGMVPDDFDNHIRLVDLMDYLTVLREELKLGDL